MAGGEDEMVAVPEEYLETVVFLCVDRPGPGVGGHVPIATAFILKVPVGTGTRARGVDYFVTARHNIDKARAYGSRLFVRVQLIGGGYEDVPTELDDWSTHDTSDVAVILGMPVAGKQVAHSSLSYDQVVGRWEPHTFVGPAPEVGAVEIPMRLGMDLYCLGLFSQYPGTDTILPVARYGRISREADVIRMETTDGLIFEGLGYLAEFLSWGGASGSPTFFWHPMVLEEASEVDGKLGVDEVNLAHVTGLMGLISAHYPIPEKARTTGDIVGEIRTNLNSGIAVVTPSDAIVQLIERDDLVEERERYISG